MLRLEMKLGNTRYMDAHAGLQVLSRRLSKTLERFEPKARETLLGYSRGVVQRLVSRHSTPWQSRVRGPTGVKAGKLFKRSGEGIREIIQSPMVVGSKAIRVKDLMVVFKVKGHIAYHEKGGTIHGSPYLTIPLEAALTSRGNPKKKRARDWANTFTKRAKSGKLFIFRKKRGSKEITPLYILKKSITIKPRLGLEYEAKIGFNALGATLARDIKRHINQDLTGR